MASITPLRSSLLKSSTKTTYDKSARSSCLKERNVYICSTHANSGAVHAGRPRMSLRSARRMRANHIPLRLNAMRPSRASERKISISSASTHCFHRYVGGNLRFSGARGVQPQSVSGEHAVPWGGCVTPLQSPFTARRNARGRWPFYTSKNNHGRQTLSVSAASNSESAAPRDVQVKAAVADVAKEAADVAAEASSVLPLPLEEHPRLRRGQLANGLRYVILPNAVPPNRFEAHLEVHVGSVDEEEDEQGLAHLLEHVTFLGSKKREQMLGTGARSNAYTDFHHTVFHVHAPVESADNKDMLPQVLEALDDIAFHPAFLSTRIEKERRAVLAEVQMMNTIEYRVDCKLLNQLHWENALGERFPIGLEEQIHKWDGDMLRKFHERWYFPANMTLYVVGDINVTVEQAEKLIESAFGKEKAPLEASAEQGAAQGEPGKQARMLQRHEVRPPVRHAFGRAHDLLHAPEGSQVAPEAKAYIFQHNLLQQFSLSLFQKRPLQRVTTLSDLKRVIVSRLLISVLQFRISSRYEDASPPFTAIDFDHSDSGREGCTVSSLTITSEPGDWRRALKVALEELRRLHMHGITAGELARYKAALLYDSEQLAEQAGSVPSIDNLDFLMESDMLGHTVMDQEQGHAALVAVADFVTLEDVHTMGRDVLSYVAEYGTPLEERDSPDGGVCTALVACVPASFVDEETGVESPFVIEEGDIERALSEESEAIGATVDVDVPDRLISEEDLAALMEQRQPSFVESPENQVDPSGLDEATGVTLRKLSNGISVNYRHTANEPKGAVLRMVAKGGRSLETLGGAVAVGVRTLSEAGTVGSWEREQVDLFCLSHLIHCVLEPDEEFITMDFHFAVGGEGVRAVLELLHLLLEQPCWNHPALERAKQVYLTHYRTQHKSLERATAACLMEAMLGPDRRFLDPSPEEVAALTLEAAREAVQAQLLTENLEVSIVGDFDPTQLDQHLLAYLGTVRTPAAAEAARAAVESPLLLNLGIPVTDARRAQRLHLPDSDERACAYLAGPAPNRWAPLPQLARSPSVATAAAACAAPGELGELSDAATKRAHPLYTFMALSLLVEIVNSRLFTTVRDALGLTYDVSFELSMFERLEVGWYVLSVTATPSKIDDALGASLRTLRGLATQQVSQQELNRARRTLLTRHDSDLRDNGHWLSLLSHLQSAAVPKKALRCISDIPAMYEAATVEDVQQAYAALAVDDKSIFSCVGVSGPAGPAGGAQLRSAMGAAQASVLDKSKMGQDMEESMAQSAAMAAAAVMKAFKAAGMDNLANMQSMQNMQNMSNPKKTTDNPNQDS